ncbi:hypothetical protein D9M72_611830 [compost metagenome]
MLGIVAGDGNVALPASAGLADRTGAQDMLFGPAIVLKANLRFAERRLAAATHAIDRADLRAADENGVLADGVIAPDLVDRQPQQPDCERQREKCQ